MEYSQRRFELGWLFCGIAIALGWGIRGEIGGSEGATVPGALLGLAVALTSGRPGWVRAASVFGMAGALGFALGGQMSYGLLVGYTKGIDTPNVAYGYAMIGLVGGLWGAFGAGCLGLAASRVKYPVWQVIAFVIAAIVLGRILHLLLVGALGLHVNPPRGDSWPECIGAVLALITFAAIRRDPLPMRLAFWGFAAGSVGFMIGDMLQVIPSYLAPDGYNWWKLMEQSFGFILGAGVGWAVNRETRGEPDGPSPIYALAVFGLIVSAWYVPTLVFNDMLERVREVYDKLLPVASVEREAAGFVDKVFAAFTQFHLREFAVLLLIIAVAYTLRRRTGKLIAPDLFAKLLFSFVMWFAVLFTDLKMSLPVWSPGALQIHYGFLVMAIGLTVWVWFGFPVRPAQPAQPSAATAPPPLRFIAPIYMLVIYPLLAFVLAAASIASHPGQWRGDAHVRFGEPPAPSQEP